MIELLTTVQTRAAELTDGALFSTPGGDTAAIQYKVGDYPYKTGGDADVPLCVVLVRGFTALPRPAKATVQLAYTLYNDNGSLAAMTDIERLSGLLDGLTERGIKYVPWKLDSAAGFIGDADNGAHPDPQYFLTYTLEFSKP